MNTLKASFWSSCVYNGPPNSLDLAGSVAAAMAMFGRAGGIQFAVVNCTENVVAHVVDPSEDVCDFATTHYDYPWAAQDTRWPSEKVRLNYLRTYPSEIPRHFSSLSAPAAEQLAASPSPAVFEALAKMGVAFSDGACHAIVMAHPSALAAVPLRQRTHAMALHAAARVGGDCIHCLAPFWGDDDVVDAVVRNRRMDGERHRVPTEALVAACARHQPGVDLGDAVVTVAPAALPLVSWSVTAAQWQAAWGAVMTQAWATLEPFLAAVPAACQTKDLWLQTATRGLRNDRILQHCAILDRDIVHKFAHARKKMVPKGAMFNFVAAWDSQASLERAVRAEPMLLRHIAPEKQTAGVVRAALETSGFAIEFVASPSEEWNALAVATHPRAARFVTSAPL